MIAAHSATDFLARPKRRHPPSSAPINQLRAAALLAWLLAGWTAARAHELRPPGAWSEPEPAGRQQQQQQQLASQLSKLVMNEEPEQIARKLNGSRLRGLMEAQRSGAERGGPALLLEAHASDAEDRAALAAAAEQLADGPERPQEPEGPTCSPDYEDQTLIEASGNLTGEQQQQLLASAGLLGSAGSNNLSEPPELAGGRLCVQPGSRMIEVITKVITPILFSIIIVVGLLGNIIVMLVILDDRKSGGELTPTNLLILDLTLADLSFIIFCIPFTGWDYSVGHWVFGPTWCKCNQYLIVVCALSSIYTLVLMSIDRFMAIVYPIECISYRTSKNMLYAILIKWILILLIASPTVTMHGLVESPMGLNQFNCRFLTDQFNPLHFQITFFITSYLFPLILIFCLYLSLLNKLWFGSKPQGHKESLKMLESKKKVTWLVASIVVVFALCWCPIQVMLILMRLKTHRITATYVAIQVFSHTLGYMNSCVNPIVYAFASETFVNSFRRSSLGRLCCQCFGLQQLPGASDHDRPASRHLHHLAPTGTTTRASLIDQYSTQNLRFSATAESANLEPAHRSPEKQTSTNKQMKLHPNEPASVSLQLEPRDRHSSPVLPAASNGQPPAPALVPREPTLASAPAKQQLVARVLHSGTQVAHRCEPDYK